MQEKAKYGLAVSDIHRSIHFYRDVLELPVDRSTGIPDTALLTTAQNQRFILAGPTAPEWGELLAKPYTVLHKGEKIFMRDPDFEQRLKRLSTDATIEYELIERPWGDRIIEIEDPDGYGVSFWMIWERTREQILEHFRMMCDGIREATEDLSEVELGWRPQSGAWSIREIVHHVADANLTVLHAVRVALAEPGREYQSNPYDQNQYTAELCYQERDIEPSLRLIEAMHDMLVTMIQVIPDAWDRTTRTSTGGETSVESYMAMQAAHGLEHLEQIKDVRRAMGK